MCFPNGVDRNYAGIRRIRKGNGVEQGNSGGRRGIEIRRPRCQNEELRRIYGSINRVNIIGTPTLKPPDPPKILEKRSGRANIIATPTLKPPDPLKF